MGNQKIAVHLEITFYKTHSLLLVCKLGQSKIIPSSKWIGKFLKNEKCDIFFDLVEKLWSVHKAHGVHRYKRSGDWASSTIFFSSSAPQHQQKLRVRRQNYLSHSFFYDRLMTSVLKVFCIITLPRKRKKY